MSYATTVRGTISNKGYNRFKNITSTTAKLLALSEDFAKRREGIDKHPDYNEAARGRYRREAAEKFAPTLGQLQREVAHERAKLEKARSDLSPKFPAVSEAMMLALSSRLAAMTNEQRANALKTDNADPRLLATVFQMPEILHGVDAGLVTAIRNKIVESKHAPELAELAAREDAIDLADGAVRVAKDALLANSGTASGLLAEKWLAPLTAPSKADQEAERALALRRDAVEIAELAKTLDFKARTALVEALDQQQNDDLERRTAEAQAGR